MSPEVERDTGVSGALTDGTGIGRFDVPKIVKDFIADALMGAAAGLVAVQITDIPQSQEGLTVAWFALLKALIQAGYRAALKWSQSP